VRGKDIKMNPSTQKGKEKEKEKGEKKKKRKKKGGEKRQNRW
jgi:hypothetical protein